MQVIPHPVSDIAFGDGAQVDLHACSRQKHAALRLIKDDILRTGNRQQRRNVISRRNAVTPETNFPALHQRAYRQVKGAVLEQACRFCTADQLEHRSADDDRMLPSRVVDVHHLRVGTVDGKQIFILFDESKHAGGEGFVMGEEFQEDGGTHQDGGVTVNTVI